MQKRELLFDNAKNIVYNITNVSLGGIFVKNNDKLNDNEQNILSYI
jgi:hypothetical protein